MIGGGEGDVKTPEGAGRGANVEIPSFYS